MSAMVDLNSLDRDETEDVADLLRQKSRINRSPAISFSKTMNFNIELNMNAM